MLLRIEDLPPVANDMMNMLHEDELSIINEFHDAILARDIDKIDEMFKVVLFDIEDHFSTEEEMMERSQYPFTQVHKSDHDTMRAKMKNYHERWQILKGPKELKGFLETEFKQWLVLHISKWDAETALHIGNG